MGLHSSNFEPLRSGYLKEEHQPDNRQCPLQLPGEEARSHTTLDRDRVCCWPLRTGKAHLPQHRLCAFARRATDKP
jgi:hypothetical protein